MRLVRALRGFNGEKRGVSYAGISSISTDMDPEISTNHDQHYTDTILLSRFSDWHTPFEELATSDRLISGAFESINTTKLGRETAASC